MHVSWRVVIINEGEYLRLKLDNLLVTRGSDEISVPLSDISMIVIENLNCVLSTRLMDACNQNNVLIVNCDYKHIPSGIFYGLNTHTKATKVLYSQMEWSQEFKDITWQYITFSKISNQIDHLKMREKNLDKIKLMYDLANEIKPGDKTNREGHAAKVYFNELFGMDFKRDDDTVENAALNYLYSIIRAYFTRLVVGYGYTGMIGLFHKNQFNNFNLVDDLMEVFRPIADYYVINLLKEYEYFNIDLRIELINFLHTEIKFTNHKMIMSSAIEKYFQSFMKYTKHQNISKFEMPHIAFYE